MDTENFKFRQGFSREVRSFGFEKFSWNFHESLLTLQEVEKLLTLVYFQSKGHPWHWLSPRGCLVDFRTQNNTFSRLSGMNRSISRSIRRSSG